MSESERGAAREASPQHEVRFDMDDAYRPLETIDEVVGEGVYHLEFMDDNHLWLQLGPDCFSITARGKLRFVRTCEGTRAVPRPEPAAAPLNQLLDDAARLLREPLDFDSANTRADVRNARSKIAEAYKLVVSSGSPLVLSEDEHIAGERDTVERLRKFLMLHRDIASSEGLGLNASIMGQRILTLGDLRRLFYLAERSGSSARTTASEPRRPRRNMSKAEELFERGEELDQIAALGVSSPAGRAPTSDEMEILRIEESGQYHRTGTDGPWEVNLMAADFDIVLRLARAAAARAPGMEEISKLLDLTIREYAHFALHDAPNNRRRFFEAKAALLSAIESRSRALSPEPASELEDFRRRARAAWELVPDNREDMEANILADLRRGASGPSHPSATRATPTERQERET